MSREEYTYAELPWQHGTKVRAKPDSEIKGWSNYVGTVLGYRVRADGSFEYKVRAWRANQHWWKEADLELVYEHQLCINCRKLVEDSDPACCCNHCKPPF